MPCEPMYIHEPAVIWPYIMSPFLSSSLKCSQLAQAGTRLELASSTRGASACVGNTPTGLPDWISSVSLSFNSRSDFRMASKHSQLRAARPMPPYTTSACGFSATSGSRLFCNMRNGASVSQLLQVSWLPRGARTVRVVSMRVGAFIGVIRGKADGDYRRRGAGSWHDRDSALARADSGLESAINLVIPAQAGTQCLLAPSACLSHW